MARIKILELSFEDSQLSRNSNSFLNDLTAGEIEAVVGGSVAASVLANIEDLVTDFDAQMEQLFDSWGQQFSTNTGSNSSTNTTPTSDNGSRRSRVYGTYGAYS
ncbi:MAG: hypothetical protein N4J56_003791 [Chroococcidiopsis sp. SAG 2025]|uniref:hypothetical protein n=1 Tax=Chroococcidiopsis sp. SAG 2025 TaxID=171389 RepID=UPI0029372697|nr:hypothetical protein [Chroococcidiopsis sp. SAG 2025]MDV2994137.1 hypothetical protein [Chroococcidiopsis sp. SAG 2025]